MESSILCLLMIVSCSFWYINEASGASCDGIKPCVPLSKANVQFQKCCNSKKLGASCTKHCKYDVKLEELKAAIMKNGDCQLSQVRNYLRCAANNKNNNACCKKTGVLDGKREICEPFCNPNSSDFPQSTKGAGKYLKCTSQFDQIMKCHHASCR